MCKRATILSLITLVLAIVVPRAQADDEISVMTQNQYLGGDLGLILAATDETFNDELVKVLRQIAANNFPLRARRQAADIAEHEPHLVGLQEVWSFNCIDLIPLTARPPNTGCDNPSIAGAFRDHLQETLMALDKEDASYEVVATVKNIDLTDLQLPDLPPGVPFVIESFPALFVAFDRDVILARSDIEATPVDFRCMNPSVDGCNFNTALGVTLPDPVGVLNVPRGFVAVDVTLDDQHFRFVNTHLEVFQPDPLNPLSRFFQAAQAAELVATLETTLPPGRTMIVVGDINSSPEDTPLDMTPIGTIVPPYQQFIDARYVDAWTFDDAEDDDGDADPGFTCCQLADLSNQSSILNQRIDMIFVREPVEEVDDATLLGVTAARKPTPPGLGVWPSDHASVAAELEF